MADPDKLFQDAINAIQGVKNPETERMMIALQSMVQQGVITPQQMQVALVDRNAFDNIVSSPEFAAAQQAALGQLQQIGEEGGLTAIDRAKLQDVTDQVNTTNRGQEQAIMQNARERGIGGSGLELASRLQAQQSAADTASRQGTDVAAMARQRALDAIQGAGSMGAQMQQAEFNRGAMKAQSQNAIDAANAAMTNQGNLYNTQAANAAQAANLGEKQRISDANIGLANTQEQYNKNLIQQKFQNDLAKAQGVSNAYSAWGNAEAGQSGQKQGSQNAMLGQGLQTGGTIIGGFYGGPAGAAAGGTAGKKMGDEYADKNGGYGQQGYSDGGIVQPDNEPKQNKAPVAPAAVVNPPAAVPITNDDQTIPTAKSGASPTHTSTETGGSSPGGASTGGVGSGIGGAGTGGAATGGASTGGAGTVNVTISGNSTTKTASGNKGSASSKKDSKSSGGDGGNDKKSPITINISNVGGKTDAGNVASGDGPGASGKGGSGEGSGGGGGGAAPSEPKGFKSSPTSNSKNQDKIGMAKGGVIDFRSGGQVPGCAKMPGDNPVNDTVYARLSPGELVVPRSLVSEFNKHAKPKNKQKLDHDDMAELFKALASTKEKE